MSAAALEAAATGDGAPGDPGIGRPSPALLEQAGNIVAFFQHWVERAPDRPALVFPRRTRGGLAYDVLTFRQLDEEGRRIASGLRRLGVGPGDRVMVLVPISRQLYALLVALARLGAVAVFLDPWVGSAQRRAAAELVAPKAFVGIPKAHLLRLVPEFRRIPLKLVACAPRGAGWLFGTPLERLVRACPPEEGPFERCDLDASSLITFTTGSTGRPKGSDRTHRFINFQGATLDRHLRRLPGDVDMPALPIFVLLNLASGVPSVLPLVDWMRVASVDPAAIVDEIADWKVTTIGGSPAYLLPIARHCLARGIELGTVRGVVTGGAPVPPELLRLLQQVCPRARGNIEVIFGSTEAEPVASIEADEVLRETAARTEAGEGNCVGRPVAEVELKLCRPEPGPWQLAGRGWEAVEVAPGAVGEVLVTGDHVQKSYWNDPQAVLANKVTGPDGRVWHRMGDLARLDAQGRLWLVGRVHNAVAAGGRTLYPIQVEARAEAVPGVRKAALLSWEERATVVVEPAQAGADQEALSRAVEEHLRAGGFEVDVVRCVREIPLDPRHNAKIELARLRALLAAEGGA